MRITGPVFEDEGRTYRRAMRAVAWFGGAASLLAANTLKEMLEKRKQSLEPFGSS
jgi:hypothetical protein